MKLIIIIVVVSCFSGCVSKLSRLNPPNQIELVSIVKPTKIAVKTVAQAASAVYWSADEYRYMALNEDQSSEIVKIIEDSGAFSVHKIKSFGVVHENVKKDDLQKIETIFNRDSFDSESDFQINLYRKTKWGHAYMALVYGVWGIVHAASLGLIPVWVPLSDDYFGDFRSKDGKVIYKFEKKCKASIWSWSPFLLTSEWSEPNQVRNEFDRECILSILDDAQKAEVIEKSLGLKVIP